jgi:hypothetical protein
LTDAAQENVERGNDPKIVPEAVCDTLTAKSPRLRYPIGKGFTSSRLRRLVPAGMFNWTLHKQFRLG